MSIGERERDAAAARRAAQARDLLRLEDLHINIRLQRGSIDVLKGVSFRIPAGKTVALVGESGSGKTIAAQAILGILPNVAKITRGRILFRPPDMDGGEFDHAAEPSDGPYMRAMRGGAISMIFQEPMTSLSPLHRVGHQVQEALTLHRASSGREAYEVTVDMLRMVGFPDPKKAYAMYPIELSGGMRQRAMIAMAAICHPALLIADEPTTALDVTIQAQVLALLKDLQEHLSMSLLLITHDFGIVANMADEIVVLYHGEVMEAGNREDIFRRTGHAYTKALMRAVPSLDLQPGERLRGLWEIDRPVPDMMKRRAEARPRPAGPILRVEGLTKTFNVRGKTLFSKAGKPFTAVDDVSFDIRPGECFGIVGESGSGKTTLSKLILRALDPDRGAILFDDGEGLRDVVEFDSKELFDYRKRAQMVFQDPFGSLNPRATVLNILTEPLEIHEACRGAQARQIAEELVRLVGLQPTSLNRFPHSFSGGQRQRIGIARALALSPSILVCDEPVSALDVSVQAQILNLLKKLQAELKLTSIFISHNLAVIKYMADRIAVMRRGRIVELATAAELFCNPSHPYTRQLLEAVPHADLDHPLPFDHFDFKRGEAVPDLELGWDSMFRTPGEGSDRLALRPISDSHFVLTRQSAELRSLAS
ncbi:dipeptide ABC transporter ATP-binding protein [Mesorhizobium xinjiangense]|uniref:dipeptide ABC transporter ATP-binding protein n=1 Tax=Mesorhizobium xinjiangense TaxID=2678685 RepID=UPI001F218634|nr:ABC transporter ATP-binding protein [Mesorhizobium xinjiangense]